MTNHSALQSQQTDGLPTATIADTLSEVAQKILGARGLNLELIMSLGWRSSKRPINGSETIEIPYYVDGAEVNTKTRTISGDKEFRQVKDGRKCFYNQDAIKDWQASDEPLLICEGEMDCIAALQSGYIAVSVPDGAPAKSLTDTTLKYSYLDDFPPKGVVIICADGDDAGANLLHDLSIRLGKHRCKWVKYPKHCKDLNEVLIRYGVKGIDETIKRATWMDLDGIYRMSELPPIAKPEFKGCGVIPINIRKSDFSVWTGIPSHGKSTFTNFLSSVFASEGWNIAVASFEQEPQTQHRAALRALLRDTNEADRIIDSRYTFVVPNINSDEDANLGWLLEKMAAAVTRNEVDMIIIDPWNEIEHSFDRREMSQTDYTGFAIKQLKKFARRYKVHIAVVAHPAKMQRNKDGEYPIPSLYDIADSAHWANKADLGVIIHRKGDQNLVRVQKSRYHEDIGIPDDYYVDYHPQTKQFTEATAIFSHG
jgi:twinkle protein